MAYIKDITFTDTPEVDPIKDFEIVDVEPRLVIVAYTRYITFTYNGVEYTRELRYDPNNGFEMDAYGVPHPKSLMEEKDVLYRIDALATAFAEKNDIEDEIDE